MVDIQELQFLISQGDHNAFDCFYHMYYKQVFRFSFYFLKDKYACQEVVANVFYDVWKYRKRLSSLSNVETYLYVMVKNEVNRYQQTYQEKFVPIDDIPLHFQMTEDSPENILLSAEIESLLNRVVADLPEKCRIVFLMVREERMKPKDIAQILSINESTVRVHLKTAVDRISEKLRPYFDHIIMVLFCILCQ